MATGLERFRDHCRRMASAEHKPECPSLRENWPPWSEWVPEADAEGNIYRMVWRGPRPAPPTCGGCNSEADRVLFARLADEVESYQPYTEDGHGIVTEVNDTDVALI